MRRQLFYTVTFVILSFFEQAYADNCFVSGDGKGGTKPKKLGTTATSEECIILVKSREPTANGATFGIYIQKKVGKAPCWAQFGMTGIKSNSRWQTCQFKAPGEEPAPPEGYVVNCTKRNFQDSANFCKTKGWTMGTFQSDTDVEVAKDKVGCNVYIGATSDGKGNWEWIDSSPWWAYGNNDGLNGIIETKIVWRAADNKWNDWGTGDDLMGVICQVKGGKKKQT